MIGSRPATRQIPTARRARALGDRRRRAGPSAVEGAVEEARISAEAANRARELQALPSNVVTPGYLAERASRDRRRPRHVSAEALDRGEIEARGMGGLVAVAKGSAEEPRLITLSYSGPGASGETLGLVGKAVTFDTGGISIKPAAKMEEMKMDMSGGAAVLESVAAIAELALPIASSPCVPGDREHAGRVGDQARRHHHAAQRADGRGQQHRRRGPPDPGRRADLLRARAREPTRCSTSPP